MGPWELADALGDPCDKAAWRAAQAYLTGSGIDCAMLIQRSDSGSISVRASLEIAWMADHKRVIEDGQDPFLHYCLPTYASLPTGFDQMDRYRYLDREARALIGDAYDRTGLRAGRSVIVRADPTGRGAALGWHLLTSRSGADFERQFAACGESLALACHMIAARLPLPPHTEDGDPRLRRDNPTLGSGGQAMALTARERECLQFVAAGYRVARIAHRLSLSEKTVEFHLANARRRLNAQTTGEAVANAVVRGLIAS